LTLYPSLELEVESVPPSLNFPQLDFVKPSSGFHPVTWERIRSILDNVFIAQEALSWVKESNQDLVLLLLDFEKAFDRIEWGFLFGALEKLGFRDTWIRWVKALYKGASSIVKLNGEIGPDFKLAHSVRQGCPLAPYLFILATDVLGYMLADPKNEVEGLSLPRGGPHQGSDLRR